MNRFSIEALPILPKGINKISNDVLFIPEFQDDSEKLAQKFMTLGEDIKTFIQTGLKLYHDLKVDNEGIKVIQKVKRGKVYEAFKFACRSIKGQGAQSGIKVIYAYFEDEKKIELIEIYHEKEKSSEAYQRITKYYQN